MGRPPLLLVCQIVAEFMSDADRASLLQSLRSNPKYDFSVVRPGHIEDLSGKFIPLPLRCWKILSGSLLEPLDFCEAENLLNLASEQQNAQKEIRLEQSSIEYIVSRTNTALRLAKSTHRLSGAGGSFSIRKIVS